MILSLLPHHISLHHSSLTLRVSSSAAVSIAVRAQGPIVPVLFMFKWFIFHFRPPLLELDFCKSALSVVLVGFIYGSQLSGWFLVANQFIIKCFEINLNTVWNHLLESARSSLRKTISSEGPSSSLVACDILQTLLKYGSNPAMDLSTEGNLPHLLCWHCHWLLWHMDTLVHVKSGKPC